MRFASHIISVGKQFWTFPVLVLCSAPLDSRSADSTTSDPWKIGKIWILIAVQWTEISKDIVVGVERECSSLRKLCHQFSPTLSNSVFADVLSSPDFEFLSNQLQLYGSTSKMLQKKLITWGFSYSLISYNSENQFLKNSMQKVSSLSVGLRENALAHVRRTVVLKNATNWNYTGVLLSCDFQVLKISSQPKLWSRLFELMLQRKTVIILRLLPEGMDLSLVRLSRFINET